MQQAGNLPIHSPDSAMQRNRERDVIEGVDKFLETSLRFRDELPQLIELLVGRLSDFFLQVVNEFLEFGHLAAASVDRKSTRLNSSHLGISYAVFCLKKKSR